VKKQKNERKTDTILKRRKNIPVKSGDKTTGCNLE